MNEMKKPPFCAAIGTGHATAESSRVLFLIKRNRRETIPPFSGRQPEGKQQTCATQWVSSETTSARGGREGEYVQGVAPLSFLLSIYLSIFFSTPLRTIIRSRLVHPRRGEMKEIEAAVGGETREAPVVRKNPDAARRPSVGRWVDRQAATLALSAAGISAVNKSRLLSHTNAHCYG